MKKLIAAVLFLSCTAVVLIGSARQKNADPHEKLLRLYKAHRYFESHDALAEMKNDASPELNFFRGVLGRDVPSRRSRLIFNFESMSFILE